MNQPNIQMKKGEYLLIYGGIVPPSYTYNQTQAKEDADEFFGQDISTLYDHIIFEDYFYNYMRDGNDNFTLRSYEKTWVVGNTLTE